MITHYRISDSATFLRTTAVDELIQVVSDYNAALKSASIAEIMDVYMPDSVLLPENLPPVSGLQDIEAVYEKLVNLIKFNDDSVIDIVDAYASGDCGFVRSLRTHGSVTELETGVRKLPVWRELWVFKRNADKKFKFAVYAYGNAPDGEFDPTAAVLW